jgi:hypothetical protein
VAFDFAEVRQEELEIRNYRVDKFILYPKHWREYSNEIQLSWHKVRFANVNVDKIPNNRAGVYSFVADPCIAKHPVSNYLLYIGKVRDQNFRDRYRQYLRAEKEWQKRPHIADMINKWSDHLYFCYAEVSDIELIDQLEEDLITAFLPPMNKAWPAKIRDVMKLIF